MVVENATQDMDASVTEVLESQEIYDSSEMVRDIEEAVQIDTATLMDELQNPDYDGNFFMIAIQKRHKD